MVKSCTESELDEKTQLKGTVVGTPKPWMEWDIAAEPEPYEESYLPGNVFSLSQAYRSDNEV